MVFVCLDNLIYFFLDIDTINLMSTSLKQIIPLSLALLALLSYHFIGATWSDAPATAPNNNVPAPINVGVDAASNQTGSGGLAFDDVAAAKISFAGVEMRAPRYCDENGENCFVAADVGTGTGSTAGLCQKVTAELGPFDGGPFTLPSEVVTKLYSGSLNITHIAIGSNYNNGYMSYDGLDERVHSSGYADDYYDFGIFVSRDDVHMQNVRARGVASTDGAQAKIDSVGVNNVPMKMWYQDGVDCNDVSPLSF